MKKLFKDLYKVPMNRMLREGIIELDNILTEHIEDIQVKCPACKQMTKLVRMKAIDTFRNVCYYCYSQCAENM